MNSLEPTFMTESDSRFLLPNLNASRAQLNEEKMLKDMHDSIVPEKKKRARDLNNYIGQYSEVAYTQELNTISMDLRE